MRELLAVCFMLCVGLGAVAAPADFTCSDPFVVPDAQAGVYRLYHNVSRKADADPHVVMRTSKDLVDWSDPVPVLSLPPALACDSLWAPEVHAYNGKWYLFGSIHRPTDPKNLLPVLVPDFSPERRKSYLATWTFVADSPAGPFKPFADHAVTPEDWSSLDGTLFVEDGRPYMVFCHEWTQVRNGTIEAVEMSPDLSHPVGKPFTLFSAGDLFAALEGAPRKVPAGVTDGPFLYRSRTGKLLMLWSTAYKGYVQALSRSESGTLKGPWTHHEIIRSGDSGHGMIFRTFDGRLALAVHSPNVPHPRKRLRVFEVEDLGDTLKVGRQIGGDLTPPPASPQIAPEPVTVKVDETKPVHAVSKDLYGLFLEDISLSVDGCLYPELVWNRGFDFPATNSPGEKASVPAIQGWREEFRDGSAARVTLQYAQPKFANNPAYLRIEAFAAQAGVVNDGPMHELSVKAGAPLALSLWARGDAPFEVRLEDGTGAALCPPFARDAPGAGWRDFSATFTPTSGCRAARLAILAKAAGTIDLEQVSLRPAKTFRGRANGLRDDIGALMADLRPATFRFPGGCMLEGNSYASWYDWKRSVGPVEERLPLWNVWGYYQTLGLGYYEYFLYCEDLGAKPLPVFSAALDCQYRPPYSPVPEAGWAYFATNILDGIEFARGGVETKWGGLRARMGHPEPFPLELVGIGNENFGDEFFDRYDYLAAQVRKAYPDIKLVTCIHPAAIRRPELCAASWARIRPELCDFADEHLYASPSWWLNNADRYDNYPRRGVPVYVGEWATRQASDRFLNSMYNAVAEAAFKIGFERNADLVKMSAYAPLIRRAGFPGNRYSLIQLDGTDSCGAPAYWCEKMFAENRPDVTVPCAYARRTAQQPAGVDREKFWYNPKSESVEVVSFHAGAGLKDGAPVLKFANAAPLPQRVTVEFAQARPAGAVRRTTLAGRPDAKNLPSAPVRVVPRTDEIPFAGGRTHVFDLPACSVVVLRY